MNISFQGSITYNDNGPDSRNQTLTHNDGRERPLLLHYFYQKYNLNKQLFCKLMFTFHIQYLQQGVQELGTTWQLHSQCKLPLGQQLQKLIFIDPKFTSFLGGQRQDTNQQKRNGVEASPFGRCILQVPDVPDVRLLKSRKGNGSNTFLIQFQPLLQIPNI